MSWTTHSTFQFKMNTYYYPLFFGFLSAWLGLLAITSSVWAAKTKLTEIHVSLFGQPCLLQGPEKEATLKSIHAISPEQIYPDLSLPETSAPIHQALEKFKASEGLPPLLDRYKEKLTKRFKAEIAFLDALNLYKKTKNPTELVKSAKLYLSAEKKSEFDKDLKILQATPPGNQKFKKIAEQIYDLYNEGIELDEAEFHHAIEKMNIRYLCSFEEGEEIQGE